MSSQNVKKDFNSFIPFFLWLQAVIMFYHVISHIIRFYDASALFVYLFTIISAVLFIISGLGIRSKKKSALIMYWIVIVISLVIPILLPTFIGISRNVVIVINVAVAGYLTFTNWKKWN